MVNAKHSVKRQYSKGFGFLLASVIIIICVVNAFALSNAYCNHKKRAIISAYNRIDEVANNDQLKTAEFEAELNRIASVNNMEIVILDSSLKEVTSTFSEPEQTSDRMKDYIFGEPPKTKVIYETSKYRIQRIDDKAVGLEFMELWGLLSNGDIISIRSSVDSIKESTSVAVQMMLIIACASLLLGICLVVRTASAFSKPIKRLVEISERMTGLDFTVKYDVKGDSEIDVLGEHINQLSSALEKTIMDLKSANLELQKDIDIKIANEERRKEFIANVSHELKTPIALVQGYAEGLKDCVNDDPESRDFYSDVIIDEARKMNKLVKNLLELDQIENGIDKMVMEHFDVIDLIYNCASKLELFYNQENINLTLPEKTPIYVWFDEFKTEQIINNYLTNAIHYAKGEKKIVVSTEMLGNNLRIKVFNTGDNIPEESLDQLWNKFYKVDKARTREYGGSGIGLSIVKAIMDGTGHEYGVNNLEDGVEFWFDIDASNSVDAL